MMYFRPGFVCRPPLLVTWNPADKSVNIDLRTGNMVAASTASGDGGVRATKVRGPGKWYCEITVPSASGDTCIGLAAGDPTFASIGSNGTHAYMQFAGGITYLNGSSGFNGINIASGITMGYAYDGTAHLAWITGDGVHWNSAGGSNDPATGVGGASVAAFDSGGLYPCFVAGANGAQATLNAGKTSFTFTAPVGFSLWNAS